MLTRLAPTPSGFLHLGNAFSFLLTWLHARRQAGHILLRIDDLDAERKRPEFVDDVFTSLHWLGIDWDQGPADATDFEKNWTQQSRLSLYHEALASLRARDLLFACTCSRTQLRQSHGGSRYPGTCAQAQLSFEGECAWRLRVPDEAEPGFEEWNAGQRTFALGRETGSFIVRRRDGIPAYHLSSLVDDLHFGVNFIVRGLDLLPATAAQVQLALALHEPAFAQSTFLHHPLLTDGGGMKLSKSAGALALKSMRESGITAAEVIARFSKMTGLPEPLPRKLSELLDAFEPGQEKHWS